MRFGKGESGDKIQEGSGKPRIHIKPSSVLCIFLPDQLVAPAVVNVLAVE